MHKNKHQQHRQQQYKTQATHTEVYANLKKIPVTGEFLYRL